MTSLPPHEANPNTSFLMLHNRRLVFDGSTAELVHSQDPFIREYLS